MTEHEEEKSFTPLDGGYGWVIVLATTIINICVLPLVQNFGIIYAPDFEHLGITGAKTSFLLHLHSAIYCSLGLLGSPLLKKYDFRRVALVGTTLMCIGILLTSFARSYALLIFTFSILVGVGQGIMLPATYLATNTYFKKRLTLAVSFSVTGASISSIFMPQVCNLLLNEFRNTQSTVLVLFAISIIAIVCCFLLKPVTKKTDNQAQDEALEKMNNQIQTEEKTNVDDRKDELELLNIKNQDQEQIYKETTMPAKREGTLLKIFNLLNLELLGDFSFVITIIGMSISFASELNIVLMISFILPELAGFKRNEVAWALSIQSIADLIGRLAIPLIAHYFNAPPKIMYGSSLVTSTIGRTVIAFFYMSKPTIYLCVCFLGLAKGTKAVYQSVIIPKYVNLEKLPAANGLNMILTGVANLAIGPIIGAIRDINDSYVYALHAGSVISMSCVILWIFHYMFYERRKQEAVTNN